MNEAKAPFTPDWALSPGESILDMAGERGWTQVELAKRLGYTEKHISQLTSGKVPLTEDMALRLSRVLGSTPDFWRALEANYRKHAARLVEVKSYTDWAPWLKQLPIKEMMASQAISHLRNDKKNKPEIVAACLRFFGVASPDEWEIQYAGMQVSFRKSHANRQSDIGAISAWLRMGEREVEIQGAVPKYDKARFDKALKTIRALTCQPPEEFEPRMRQLLRDAGVSLALVPAIPRAYVSGVARWLNPSRPMIQLSLFGKTNDKFWFTFFHEAAHILLHANTREEKKSVFLDDTHGYPSNNLQEQAANQWAADWLIPPEESIALSGLHTRTAVESFAHRIGIHPGIVVGRLQHEKIIDISWLNDLKQSFRFTEASDAA
jgi:HTH-type transcriptional regulator/antitoxin HigA